MAAKAGDDNTGSRKWKPCARKRGESGGESTLGLEHRRNQVFDAAQLSLQDIHNTETNTCENVSHGGSKKNDVQSWDELLNDSGFLLGLSIYWNCHDLVISQPIPGMN